MWSLSSLISLIESMTKDYNKLRDRKMLLNNPTVNDTVPGKGTVVLYPDFFYA